MLTLRQYIKVTVLVLLVAGFRVPTAPYPIAPKYTFTIKNDLERIIALQIGKDITTLNQRAAYKFTREDGEKIYLYEKGEKTRLLLTISTSVEGKIYSLSDWLDK